MKIGYILPLGEQEETGAPPPYAQLREMALQAEEAGFDSVWVYDHLLYRWGDGKTVGIWESWSLFAALCEATSRVELGQLVMCAPFRNPALLAKMAITADEVSGGRTILGLGAGWHQPEFDAFGIPFGHKVDQFEEALSIIGPLLKEGKVDFRGAYFSAPECEMRPRGPRPGGPPILVASKGPRMLRLTARWADQWNAAWFGNTTLFEPRHAELLAACEQEGRDPATLTITTGVTIAFPSLGEEIPESIASPEKSITGSPEQVAAGLKQWEARGVDHVVCAVTPDTPAGLGQLCEALRMYRAG